jgi:transposase
LFHHPTRRSIGYFGAVRLRDGKFFFHRETDKFNGATFLVFLKALYRVSTAGPTRVVVITDNARYHHARLHRDWGEQHADRFELDYLPPSSPDLNPIERVWKLTRRQCLHNRYFPLLSDIVDSVETQFKPWLRGNITLRRLCAIT